MKSKPTLFTYFFIFAISALACAFVVSILVYVQLFRLVAHPDFAAALLIITCNFLYIVISSSNVVKYSKGRVWTALFLYWISVINIFILVGDLLFLRNFSDKEFPLWSMILMSSLLLLIYIIIEQGSLRSIGSSTFLAPLRLILYERFIILGKMMNWLESGWHAVIVRFVDVLLVVWLVQNAIRVIWQTAGQGSLFDHQYSELILLPEKSSNGSIFNSFYPANQSDFVSIYYTGHNFFFDIVSSISSLLWNHWQGIVAVWFFLEVACFFWASSKKLVIMDASDSLAALSVKKDENERKTESQAQPPSIKLADLLALKLEKINRIYNAVDEKRSIPSACGPGQPIDATIKVECLDSVSVSSSSQIGLGPVSIPASSISALLSRILRGPKIVISLRSRDQDEVSNIKGKFFLTASMTGEGVSHSWLVDSSHPLEEASGEKVRTVEDMVTEMAHRIFTSLQEENTGQSIAWKAMWNFNEGLSAYRDSLRSSKGHRISLSHAETKFIDSIEEQNSFSLAYYNLGVVYAETKKIDSAEACFQKAIESDPQLWEAYYAQGIAVFRRAEEAHHLHELDWLNKILAVSREEAEEKQIEDGYNKAILLCERILDIKSQQEWILEKDFSSRARAYDLNGNAQRRLACLKCKSRIVGQDCSKGQNNSDELWLAKESLEKAVQYSWMALIQESMQSEEIQDRSKIVSECSLDLADICLKMFNCPGCDQDDLLSHARSALMQAIYINRDDANIYKLLGDVAKRQKNDAYAELVYSQALRIKPESSRLRANLAAIGANDEEKGPLVWLEDCESCSCVDENTHERIFRFLAKAIEEKCDNSMLEPFYKREKLEGDLDSIAQMAESTISPHLRNLSALQMAPEECRGLCHLETMIGDKKFDGLCLNDALMELKTRLTIKKHPLELIALLDEWFDEEKWLKLADDLFLLGQVYFEKHMRMERESEDFAELSRDCLNILAQAWKAFDFDTCKSQQNPSSWLFSVPAPNALLITDYRFTKGCSYLFSWNNIPGKDEERLVDFITKDIYWAKDAKIEKIKDGKAIKISTGREALFIVLNSRENNAILISKGNIIYIFTVNAFYKRAWYNHLIESGKMLLQLGEIKKSREKYRICECFENAKENFLQAIEILEEVDPEEIKRNNIRMLLAQAYKGCEKYREALEEAEKAKDLNPLDHEVRTVLGDILCDLKEYSFGLAELENALSCKPDDPALMLKVGLAYFFAGKDCRKKGPDRIRILEKAKKHIDNALEIEVKSKANQMVKIRFWIAKTLMEMGRYDDAIPHLNILSRSESGALAELCLGYSYWKCNAHGDAERVLSKLVGEKKRLPKNGMIGREFDYEMDVNELLARAHIYLAYSYVERDSNLDFSWKIAHESQELIGKIEEKASEEYVSSIQCDHKPVVHVRNRLEIKIQQETSDGPRKRKVKAHLAECVGTICYKDRKIEEAIDYLKASIALYPDAGGYLNLAKALARKILRGGLNESEKALISREIQELCLHADSLDIKDEHKKDLDEFKEHMREKKILPEVSVEGKPS